MTRVRHRADAVASVQRLLKVAAEIDEAQDAFLNMLAEIATLERNVWTSLRAAESAPSGGIIGQRNLAEITLDRLTALVQGRAIFQFDRRSICEIAATALDLPNCTEDLLTALPGDYGRRTTDRNGGNYKRMAVKEIRHSMRYGAVRTPHFTRIP